MRLFHFLLSLKLFLFLLLNNQANSQATFNYLQPTQNINWNSLTGNNGLSQNSVTSIIQDAKGFIWIGTYDGLNRFDGFSTIVKRHQSKKSNSLSDNRILCLQQDKLGDILIATEGGGLNIYNSSRDSFYLAFDSTHPDFLNKVNTLCTDKMGNVWFGSDNGVGFIPFRSEKYDFNSITIISDLTGLTANCLVSDSTGHVWIGTERGLFVCETKGKKGQPLVTGVARLQNQSISALYKDGEQNIWVGTKGGLFSINPDSLGLSNEMDVVDRYVQVFGDKQKEIDISSISLDRMDNLWISSRNKGLFKFTRSQNGSYKPSDVFNTDRPFCNLSENMIRVILIDNSNTLWVGSYTKGLNYTNLSNKKFYTFNPLLYEERDDFGYKSVYVTTVLETENELWVGTYKNGLYRYDKITKKLMNYGSRFFKTENIISLFRSKNKEIWIGTNAGLFKEEGSNIVPSSKCTFDIRSICEDNFGRLWIAGWDRLFLYDIKNHSIDSSLSRNQYCSNKNFVLYTDSVENAVWIGTIGAGLTKVTYTEDHTFKINHYGYSKNNDATLSSNHVWTIVRDHNQTLWIGTDAGLNKCIANETGKLRFEQVKNPLLKDRKITSLLEDEASRLWIGSSQGLLSYNTQNGETKIFTYRDGLQNNNITEAAFKNEKGLLLFGTINGLNYFLPSQIKSNPYTSSTAFTELKIFNHTITTGEKYLGNSILDSNIDDTKRLTLSWRQNNFMLSFVGLHFACPEANHFRYRLIGYDKNWIETEYSQRFAAYSNLKAGTYYFQLTSSNNDGIWSKEIRTMQIVIQPAPWLTWWAKLIYVLISVFALWLVFAYYHFKNKLKNELFLEKIEREKVNELNELKLSFFTGITHELRTPLNLITGPLKELTKQIERFDPSVQFRLKLIQRNALRLTNLINQVLDLRKISAGADNLHIADYDLIRTVFDVKKSFEWIASQNQVSFDFEYGAYPSKTWFDRDKVEKILFNLLSNAFKYVNLGGEVKINLFIEQNQYLVDEARITISNTGPGITEDEQSKIFDLFHRADKRDTGSGIGLALCRKLIELHRGSISVRSGEGIGTSFSIFFPVSCSSFKDHELIQMKPPDNDDTMNKVSHFSSGKLEQSRFTILIVEDNDDQRGYMKECLDGTFHVIEESNATAGFRTAIQVKPDLIITDIMMPGTDGIELSQQLKGDKRTSHIPIIAHSIKNSETSLQQAFQAGIDDVIPKPFDYTMLSHKIKNILTSRAGLAQSIHVDHLIKPTDVLIPSADEELLKNILKIVEQNMSDPEFGVENLARLVTMSRMNLHRKLLSASGKTTSEFIREIRMKKAAQLLSTGNMRISEVMFEVGISSNFLFNKYFKEMYGKSVKEFMKS